MITTERDEIKVLFDERGLLGLAFHPEFKTNGRFFVYYSTPMRSDAPLRTRLYWNHTVHVSEFKVSKDDPNKANPISERILLQIDQPQFNHNGGNVTFDPDGYLYVSIGDGGYANDQAIGHSASGNAQDPTNLLGSIIRIDVNNGDPYAIPSDNPFVGSTDARQEIFAYGLRNVWRMSFDAGVNSASLPQMWDKTVGKRSTALPKASITAGTGWKARPVSIPTIQTNTRRNARTRATARSSSTRCWSTRI